MDDIIVSVRQRKTLLYCEKSVQGRQCMSTWAEKIHKNRILQGFSLPISVILDMNGQKI